VPEDGDLRNNAGFQAWNMSKGIAAARGYARQARELRAEFEARQDPEPDQVAEARRLVGEIERIATGADAVWGRIEAALGGTGVLDPEHDGVTVIRNRGADRPLTERLREIWRDFEGRTAALTLLEQLEAIAGPVHGPRDQLWRPPHRNVGLSAASEPAPVTGRRPGSARTWS
jgi:hypothetical protein